VQPEVDRVALDHYLACRFVPSPRTLFRGVQKLPPASMLVVESERSPRVESWREGPGAPFSGAGDEELGTQLAERFTDAVERQMMSDVPYGAFLSGGVDSAAVVAAMKLRSSGSSHAACRGSKSPAASRAPPPCSSSRASRHST
jgi:asparagine synthase (glutamine-hydrolysing)